MTEAARVLDEIVAISRGQTFYPGALPYDPDSAHPELAGLAPAISAVPNPAYEGVRNALRLLGCDARRMGVPDWNLVALDELSSPEWIGRTADVGSSDVRLGETGGTRVESPPGLGNSPSSRAIRPGGLGLAGA